MPKFSAPSLIVAVAASALLAGCAGAPAGEPVPATATVNYEGLATVRSRAFDTAQVRPDTNFGAYSRIILAAPELAYRAPDQAAMEFPLTEEQKERFRDALAAAFAREFGGLERLAITDTPGPNTLALHVRVQDIVVKVAARSVGRGGRSGALLEASSDAVIVVEVRDSQSNSILARGVDAATAQGAATRRSADEVKTRFESSASVVEDWARITRKGVEALIESGR
ncbi:MAG: DUF3313 family protein [Woeseiaceae bacterium]